MRLVLTYLKKQQNNVIAVVGCDGSGKSTLTADLFRHIQQQHQGKVELLYLGQSSGDIGDWIKGLPLIGAPFGRYLLRKAERAHGNTKESSGPDTLTAIVIYCLSLWRAYKFHKMLRLNRQGVVVITDRYPQAEVGGFYFDGAGLGAVNAQGWLARQLTRWEQHLYNWMATHVPALVIRLNIDAETAHARKPDHKLAMLHAKTTVIPTLHFNHANILDLSSLTPYEQVLSEALNKVYDTLKMH